MQKTIMNSKYLCFLMIFSLFPPAYLLTLPVGELFLPLMQRGAGLVISIIYFADIKHHSKTFNIILWLLWIELFLMTVVSEEALLSSYFSNMVSIMSSVFFIEEMSLRSAGNGLKCLYWYFSIATLVNTATMFLVPQGLYTDSEGRRACWLLADDNTGYAWYIMASTIALLYCYYIVRRMNFVSILTWASAFVFVFSRKTATGTACQIVWAILFFGFHLRWFRKLLKMRLALYASLGSFFFVVLNRKFIFSGIVTALGKEVTLTGRTLVWDSTLKVVAKHPLLGAGVYSSTQFNYMTGYEVLGPHNYILMLLLWGGAVAVALFAAAFFVAYKTNRRWKDTQYMQCMSIGLTICALRYLTETGNAHFFYMHIALLAYTGPFLNSIRSTAVKRLKIKGLPRIRLVIGSSGAQQNMRG